MEEVLNTIDKILENESTDYSKEFLTELICELKMKLEACEEGCY